VPATTITIGGSRPFVFSAAHAALHGGQLEPLHGHTFTVTLRLHGEPGEPGETAC
jgi:6-pyruvoyl-tetrahydropterin synthase